jgi:hypothetical protein
VTPRTYVLAHSPLTGPVAWGRLPSLLQDQGYDVLVINVDDDDEPPYADRYVVQATAEISAASVAAPMIFVAHSGAGPLLPAITATLTSTRRPPGGYIFLDAGIPRPGQPSRLDLLRKEDSSLAAEFLDSLRAGTRFPAWTSDDLVDIVPKIEDRIALVESLRPRALNFFTEPLPELEGWPDAPCGYLRTSPAYDFWIYVAEQCGWPVVRRDLGHFPALAHPEATLEALQELVALL